MRIQERKPFDLCISFNLRQPIYLIFFNNFWFESVVGAYLKKARATKRHMLPFPLIAFFLFLFVNFANVKFESQNI